MEIKAKKIFIVGVIGIVFCLMGCNNRQNVDSEKDFSSKNISSITIDNASWNMKIQASNDDKIHVHYDGKVNENSSIQVSQNDNELIIQQNTISSENIATQFSFGETGKIILYIPKDTVIPLDINNGSGDIEIEAVHFCDFTMENDSGDITMSESMMDSLKIDSSTGDIKITEGSCPDLKIETKSAYVTIKNLDIQKGTISTKSGEINMGGVQDYNSISLETDSGDITLSHGNNPSDLSYDISSGSDDVTIQLLDTESTIDMAGCKQGIIGKGNSSLSIMSDSGTVLIK